MDTTPADTLRRSDLAALRLLASAARDAAFTRKRLVGDVSPEFVTTYAQDVTVAAVKFQTILELVRSTGTARREADLFVQAHDGDETNLWS